MISASTSSSGAKTKTTKRFLDHGDALKLATSIAETQERKSQISVQKRIQQTENKELARKTKSTTKEKLKEIKAQIASNKARAKKSKARKRKRTSPEPASSADTSRANPQPKKRVSFA
ncbi:hypothetical protein GYMLUDRAFT_50374 [Collybiopsis luxurians FD-317 M1]|uniref:Uncharacterized protein n=1 Tax=Collybiopsis luxurians FD-317 M1 TaxID=944289 RepID=A0A0D0BBK1_9AGAR|nr:hypothetical protein GYMLUDRAFT_50374 [Collybiopsis luxurians FD-317 M1]